VNNRLKAMGEMKAWKLLVGAAIAGATRNGLELKRRPGRGLSNVYETTKNGSTHAVSIRTTRDRWMAFPPMNNGTRYKTLDDVDQVLVAAVDDQHNPQNVDIYLFPANEVRRRFDVAYAARIANGNTVRNDYGMWVKLDPADSDSVGQIGAGIAVDYPRIARFTIDELEFGTAPEATKLLDEDNAIPESEEIDRMVDFSNVADVLSFARARIAELTGIAADTIRLELRMAA